MHGFEKVTLKSFVTGFVLCMEYASVATIRKLNSLGVTNLFEKIP